MARVTVTVTKEHLERGKLTAGQVASQPQRGPWLCMMDHALADAGLHGWVADGRTVHSYVRGVDAVVAVPDVAHEAVQAFDARNYDAIPVPFSFEIEVPD